MFLFLIVPLNKKWIIIYPDSSSLKLEFSSWQICFLKICTLLLCGNVLQQHNSPLHTISKMMIPNINMLGLIIKKWIFREFDTTLFFIVNHIWFHLLTKQTNKNIPYLDSLIHCFTRNHVLFFCWTECNWSLFPIVWRKNYRPNTKYTTWCVLPIGWAPLQICIG